MKPEPAQPATKTSLFSIAKIVAVATLISKIFGLLRSSYVAAVFGVGAVADAYNYAYIIPGFVLVLLGGINGPLHVSLVSILSKQDKSTAAAIVENVTSIVSIFLLGFTVLLILFTGVFIDAIAPGLSSDVRDLAILQLQIMAPITLFAGLIGIGFGSLNAAQHYWLPSVSPMFSSLTVIFGLGWFQLQSLNQTSTSNYFTSNYLLIGSWVLAGGTLTGAIIQWLIQFIVQSRTGMGQLRLRCNWNHPRVKQAIAIMLPAIFSTSMGQINIYVDLYFASYLPGAASALNYAGLLAQTPKGIISSVILIPLLPVFSQLTDPDQRLNLKRKIRQGLILTALTMLPLGGLMIALATPIVKLVFERQAFDPSASNLVAAVLMAYGLGAFTSIGVGVLVRVFYALEDGQTPFRITLINIFLNIILDYVLVQRFGTPGLVLASMGLNLIAMLMMLWCLHRRLDGLPWREWGMVLSKLVLAAVVSACAAGGVRYLCQLIFVHEGIFILLLQLVLAGSTGLAIFLLFVKMMKLPEFELLIEQRARQVAPKKG